MVSCPQHTKAPAYETARKAKAGGDVGGEKTSGLLRRLLPGSEPLTTRSNISREEESSQATCGSLRTLLSERWKVWFWIGCHLCCIVWLHVFFFLVRPFRLLFHAMTDMFLWAIMGTTYIYNMSWEDPQIDQRLLELSEEDNIITLCSAGDNALDYILQGSKVSAVDLNPCQIALAELKMISAIHLTYDDFFAIFAESDMKLLRRVYFSTLRAHLTQSSARFWDRHVYIVWNFMYSGTSGLAAFVLFRIAFPLCGLGGIRRCISNPSTTQKQFMEEVKRHRFRLKVMMHICDNYLFYAFAAFAGVPKAQLKLGLHRRNNAQHIFTTAFMQQQNFVKDNYFFLGYILGRWTRECCPRYLKRENFTILKNYLKEGHLTLVTGTLDGYLGSVPDQFTVASLLDHMDWMSYHQINVELSHLLPKMHPTRGRLFWRSFSETLHAPPLRWLRPQRVNDSGDRVGMYFSTWTADVNKTPYTLVSRCAEQCNTTQEELYRNESKWRPSLSLSGLITPSARRRKALTTSPSVASTISTAASPNNSDVGGLTELIAGTSGSSERLKSHLRLPTNEVEESRDDKSDAASYIANVVTGARIVAFPIMQMLGMQKPANDHRNLMEAFYTSQKEGYDAFREELLHGRPVLMEMLPIKKEKSMVWVDIGGGTARNLEFFAPATLRAYFSRICIVDISPSLLQMARRRVKRLGLDDLVELVEHDCCDESVWEYLPDRQTADIVTFSYSLSMIPDKKTALQNAVKLLKPKGEGFLGVADFFLRSASDNELSKAKQALRLLEKTLHKWWFANDHVHLLDENVEEMLNGCGEVVWDERLRGGVPFLPIFRPLHGAIILSTV